MNTSNINSKIEYEDFYDLNSHEIFCLAKEQGLINDINFLNAFKNKGTIFWYRIIAHTTLSMDILFNYFNDKLKSKRLYNIIEEQYNYLYDDPEEMEFVVRYKNYLNAYKKYN